MRNSYSDSRNYDSVNHEPLIEKLPEKLCMLDTNATNQLFEV